LPSRRISTVRAEPYVARSSSWFRAPLDGIFRPLCKLGARVKRGDTLGVISAPFSSDEIVLVAKSDGIVICVCNLPLVNEGEAIFHIAKFEKASEVEGEIASHVSNIEEDRLFDIETVPSSPLDEETLKD